jgi:hypothetical protein
MRILLLIAIGLLGLALVSYLLGRRRHGDGDDAWPEGFGAETDPERS